MTEQPARVVWASVVLDSVTEDNTPWVLFINVRPADNVGVLALDGPIRLTGAQTEAAALAAAEGTLLTRGWRRASSWEERIRGSVCWLGSHDLEQDLAQAAHLRDRLTV